MIIVVKGPEWSRVKKQLRIEANTLDERLHRAQRRVIEAMVEEAQSKVRKVQFFGGPAGHTGLRRRIARGVRAVHRGGTSSVSTHMQQRDERNLPYYVDRPKGWRHPFFGDRSQWYSQKSQKPGWFTSTFQDADERLADELMDVLEGAVRRIDDAGD
jgi:hypothetical protein